MAFLRNSAVNRINLHYGIHAFAQGAGGVFYLVFLLKAGVSLPVTLLTLAVVVAGRFALRSMVVPLAKRFGLKPLLVFGGLVHAAQYLVLAEVSGVGVALGLLCFVSALGDAFYWSCYHAYFAAIGDNEHRGHQIGAREALAAVVGIVAPLAGAWALIVFGPRMAFGAVAAVQALSVVPLLGLPNVEIRSEVSSVFRAARLGVALFLIDGWFAAMILLVWQLALFISLGERFDAYGGAMALAALVGAAAGMLLGRHIDAGHGPRAVVIAYAIGGAVALLRAFSVGLPALAIGANALGALVLCLVVPAMMTPVYNLAKASPCPLRFHVACEGAWDLGCGAGAIVAAAIVWTGWSLSIAIVLALPAALASAVLLRRYYMTHAVAIETAMVPMAPGLAPGPD